MSAENLVKMANQIAQFFATEPDQEQAVKGVQQHIQSFWTPAMRIELMAWQLERRGRTCTLWCSRHLPRWAARPDTSACPVLGTLLSAVGQAFVPVLARRHVEMRLVAAREITRRLEAAGQAHLQHAQIALP